MSTSWEGLGRDLLSANRDLRGLLGRISRDMEHGPVLSRACDRSWKILERLTAFAEDRGKTPSTSRQEKLVFDLVELIVETGLSKPTFFQSGFNELHDLGVGLVGVDWLSGLD